MAKEYVVEIGLYEDAMSPNIQALVLEQEGGGLRLTGGKGCGSWHLRRLFRCRLTVDDLKRAEIEKPSSDRSPSTSTRKE